MSFKRRHSKQLADYPGYSGNFSSTFSIHEDLMDMDTVHNKKCEPPTYYQQFADLKTKWQRDTKNKEKQNDASLDQCHSDDEPKTIKRVLVRFANRTSLQGISYINVSKEWYVKLIWIILFLSALCGMIFHLHVLCNSYLSFQKQTKVQLSFSNIKFPTVTMCNVNPVRASKLRQAMPELRQFINNIRPEKVASSLREKRTQPPPPPPPPPPPHPPSASETQHTSQPPPPRESTDQTPTGRKKRFIEDIDFNFTNTRREYEDIGKTRRRPSGRKSNFRELLNEFRYLFSTHDRETRITMGHNLSDILVSCTFAGVVCNESQFSLHPTSTYGNCYTLENADFVSYKSGPVDGLELILFLETDEYINTIASGNGFQIQIHETNTWPNPEVEGMAISAAMETNIAMRMMQIDRLDQPYGFCEDGKDFQNKYGRKYNRRTCQLFCVQKRIISQCRCYDEEKYEIQSTLRTVADEASIPACREKDDVQCMLDVELDWESGAFSCSCYNPCFETSYQITSNSRTWPSDGYARMLVEFLCNIKNESECSRFEQMGQRKLSENFLKINIYFDDLNYEEISEAPAYGDVQFLSDIGGTVGMWLGLSLLSFAEVCQFFAEMIYFLFCVRPNRKKMVTHRIHVKEGDNWDSRTTVDPMRLPSPNNFQT